jgi:hypothetical protein
MQADVTPERLSPSTLCQQIITMTKLQKSAKLDVHVILRQRITYVEQFPLQRHYVRHDIILKTFKNANYTEFMFIHNLLVNKKFHVSLTILDMDL